MDRVKESDVLRIGVTGAFGFLGANFVHALLQRLPEAEIVAFASRRRANPLFSSEKVKIENLSILRYEDMAEKFQGLDALAHFAGIVDYRRSMRRQVWDTDVLGSKKVFDAALKAKVAKLLYISSICALGAGRPWDDRGSRSRKDPSIILPGQARFADELSNPYDDPEWPTSFASPQEALDAVDASEAGEYGFIESMQVAYFDAKLAAWELAKRYISEKGLPAVTIFPGTAVGPGDLNDGISKLVNSVWEGKLRLAPPGATAFMDSRDLGAGAALALLEGKIGEAYVLAGMEEHSMSYRDFMKLICDVAKKKDKGKRPEIFTAPLGLSLAAASVAEYIAPKGSLTRALLLSGSVSNACTSAKAMRDLGYAPCSSLEEGIVTCRNFRY